MSFNNGGDAILETETLFAGATRSSGVLVSWVADSAKPPPQLQLGQARFIDLPHRGSGPIVLGPSMMLLTHGGTVATFSVGREIREARRALAATDDAERQKTGLARLLHDLAAVGLATGYGKSMFRENPAMEALIANDSWHVIVQAVDGGFAVTPKLHEHQRAPESPVVKATYEPGLGTWICENPGAPGQSMPALVMLSRQVAKSFAKKS